MKALLLIILMTTTQVVSAKSSCVSGKKAIKKMASKEFGPRKKISIDEFIMPEEKISLLRNYEACAAGDCQYLFLYQSKQGCLKKSGSFKGQLKFIGDDWHKIEVYDKDATPKLYQLGRKNVYELVE